MKPQCYFSGPLSGPHKKYLAMRAFFHQGKEAAEVAREFGYNKSTLYGMTRDFRKHLREKPGEDPFFQSAKRGRKARENIQELNQLIFSLRKQNYSVEEIVTMLNAQGHTVSYGYVFPLLKAEGFTRLPRRPNAYKQEQELPKKLEAPKSLMIKFFPERFSTETAGLLLFLPCIQRYGIDKAILRSTYPETRQIPKLNSILCFLALKLSNIRRYSTDDKWCMDRGSGLFAGLNVLPKAAWFSSYSHRVTREMNLTLLRDLHGIWKENGLLGDTVNLDFTTIPYWGENAHLENNWSGKRTKALPSMLAVLAQDSASGIIDYGDTDILHRDEHAVVLEYLDFYRKGGSAGEELKYLVFDSKFTNYENLAKLDQRGIHFLTIRRRGKNIVQQIGQLPKTAWKNIRVESSGHKKRTLKVADQRIFLKGYGKEVRQVAITGNGKVKPALIITNDFGIKTEEVVRKYARRWLVEKSISEQIDFFHLNRVSSSMVIKVDFDLTMTILAHNIYRLLARDLGRYRTLNDTRIYEKFIRNGGTVNITEENIEVFLKKKRNLPQILQMTQNLRPTQCHWLEGKPLSFIGASTS